MRRHRVSWQRRWWGSWGGLWLLWQVRTIAAALRSAVVFNASCQMMDCVNLDMPHNACSPLTTQLPHSPETHSCAPQVSDRRLWKTWAHFCSPSFRLHVNDDPITCWRSRPPWVTEYIGWGANSDASNTYKPKREAQKGKYAAHYWNIFMF